MERNALMISGHDFNMAEQNSSNGLYRATPQMKEPV